ncbi:MAG: 6-phosphofructokinase [Vicinamibacteria bacterium]|jgi:6-phosphofructokinase 1|nr:6-phosphofructokinase [Vicinamibacteria bacterium]
MIKRATQYVGVLTAGGDSPGLNAALRAIGKAALHHGDMQVIGFRDGFKGLMENRFVQLSGEALSGILTMGGTILGTSREKPHAMLVGGTVLDMTQVIVENYRRHHLDVLVCIGGGGTQKNAHRLAQAGLNVVTLPKTIDNDVFGTDVCFGFDTAMGIATEAIDRLHSTAHSHHRIIIVELMGHRAGWLALGAGVAGGADVILIPEIDYDVQRVAEAIQRRSREGKRFSIVALAEGALSVGEAADRDAEGGERGQRKKDKKAKTPDASATDTIDPELQRASRTLRLAKELEEGTGLESRVTMLGHLQRGGAPSAADRLLATRLGTACADVIRAGKFGVLIAARGDRAEPVPLEDVVGRLRAVPLDHPWIESARSVGTCLGD